jgi:hypothetical protein
MTVVLALLAVLVPASVALVGYWFKDQSQKRLAQDQRQSEDRLAQEHQQTEERLTQEQRQENDRLRLDAAMRAADLFGPSDGAESSAARSASGLLALTRLDFADLAVALLVDLWPPEARLLPSADAEGQDSPAEVEAQDSFGVSPETAIQVINAALEAGEPDAQVMAAELLCRNARTLDICNSLHWPSSVNSAWIPELPVTAKLLIADALIQMALASEHTQNALRELAVRLYGIAKGDPEPRVKGCIGTLMNAILPAVVGLGYTDFMKGPGHGLVTLDEMKDVAAKASHHPDGFFEMIVKDRSEKLEQWSKECKVVSFSAGKLATAGIAHRNT